MGARSRVLDTRKGHQMGDGLISRVTALVGLGQPTSRDPMGLVDRY